MKYMYMCQPMEHGVWSMEYGDEERNNNKNNSNNKPAQFMLLASINNKNEIINFPHTHTAYCKKTNTDERRMLMKKKKKRQQQKYI